MRQRLVALLVACVIFGLGRPAAAQLTTADIVGSVTDTSGGVVPGVTVPTALPACPSLRNEPCRAYKAIVNKTVAQ